MASHIVYQGSNPNGRKAVVRYNREYKEYIVSFHLKEKNLHHCDYYTDDFGDAVATAQLHLMPKENTNG